MKIIGMALMEACAIGLGADRSGGEMYPNLPSSSYNLNPKLLAIEGDKATNSRNFGYRNIGECFDTKSRRARVHTIVCGHDADNVAQRHAESFGLRLSETDDLLIFIRSRRDGLCSCICRKLLKAGNFILLLSLQVGCRS